MIDFVAFNLYLHLTDHMRRFILYITLFFAASFAYSQDKKVVLDAKLTAVQGFKKIDVATVGLYDGNTKIDSTVTQSGRCFFTLKENKTYKIEFSKTGYVSKHLIIETSDLPEKGKNRYKVKVEVTLFKIRPGLDVDFLKQMPMGIAKYESIYKKIKWDEEYTRSVEEKVIHETLEYHKKYGKKETKENN